jgi:peptide deformylase
MRFRPVDSEHGLCCTEPMAILKVSRMGHPVLRRAARAVERAEIRDPRFQKFVDDMIETMHEYNGVGLAAPQVHEGLRVFVAMLDGGDDAQPTVVLNPVITPLGDQIVEGWEGCLSIPDVRGRVPRAARILVKALDRQGRTLEIEADDFPARVIQHETDHLDGILFLDRMTSLNSLTYLDEYARYHAKDGDD